MTEKMLQVVKDRHPSGNGAQRWLLEPRYVNGVKVSIEDVQLYPGDREEPPDYGAVLRLECEHRPDDEYSVPTMTSLHIDPELAAQLVKALLPSLAGSGGMIDVERVSAATVLLDPILNADAYTCHDDDDSEPF